MGVTACFLQPGDVLVLCSNGLYDFVSDQEIKDTVISINKPQKAVSSLINMANNRGGYDNITVMVIKVL